MSYLTKIKFVEKRGRYNYWLFTCKCGTQKVIRLSHVEDGTTLSCGCYRNEKLRAQSIKHGYHNTRLYRIWLHMKNRCINPDKPLYFKKFTVCNEWLTFIPFKNWALVNGYKDNLSIDRIDNSNGYNPNNCRWISMDEQQRNKTNNIKYKGETASQASRRLGGGENLVNKRIKRGWNYEKAFKTPPLK